LVIVDHLHAEAVLFEGDDGCGERLLVRQRREAPRLLDGG
jgi:hypothetical protein